MPRTSPRPTTKTAVDGGAATIETKTAGNKAEPARRRAASPPPETGDRPVATPTDTAELIDVNLVVLSGHLSAEPEIRTYESGATAARFLVTVRLNEPRRRVDVIPVTVWEPDDDLTSDPPNRGERVWFTGNLQRRFWEAPDGRRSRLEVVAHQFQRGGTSDHPNRPVDGSPVATGPTTPTEEAPMPR